MATTEERMRILRMIQEGKISAEEGAKLLAALRESRKEPRPAGGMVFSAGRGGKGMLRVRVTDMITGKAKVSVNLPMGLVDAGMSIASQYAPNIDFGEIADAIRSGSMEGKIVDVVDEEDGEHIEVFID
ncbi:MAG: SHOCT-like domain-containing protein [Acidobacteriaceae bacterium]